MSPKYMGQEFRNTMDSHAQKILNKCFQEVLNKK
jgi:hypothetical protein